MKKAIIVSLLFFGFGYINQSKAQNLATGSGEYRTAIGLRAGGTSGLTFKHFSSSHNAFEGILSFWNRGIGFTGLFEKHSHTGARGLKVYYGAGAHAAFYNRNGYYRYYDGYYYTYDAGVSLGIDGIVGIEYKIPPIPIAISLDLKPFMDIHNSGAVGFAIDPGLGVKVAF